MKNAKSSVETPETRDIFPGSQTTATAVRRNIEPCNTIDCEKVQNPDVAMLLLPYDYPNGSKRICIDTEYFETYYRDNVTLVDVRTSPIEEITTRGLRTSDAEYELDAIVFATGFDAITGALLNIDIRSNYGQVLKQKWASGPRTYLGIMSAGFPNLFIITGPGSPSVLSNMTVSIEQHVEWISDCIKYMREQNFTSIEPTLEAEDAWVSHVNEVANPTLFPRANSWYLGAKIPGKPHIFMPYFGGGGNYRIMCQQIADMATKALLYVLLFPPKHLKFSQNPLGHLTLLEGPPRIGTALLATHLAACVSRGLPLLDGSPCQPGYVIFISALDSDTSTWLLALSTAKVLPPSCTVSFSWLDILIHMEKVIWIIHCLNLRQSRIVVSVRCLHRIRTLIHHHIDIAPSC
jgi:hypothetical protein